MRALKCIRTFLSRNRIPKTATPRAKHAAQSMRKTPEIKSEKKKIKSEKKTPKSKPTPKPKPTATIEVIDLDSEDSSPEALFKKVTKISPKLPVRRPGNKSKVILNLKYTHLP